MRYKDLKEEDLEYLKLIYYSEDINHNEKMSILTDKFGVTERTIRRWWKDNLSLSNVNFNIPPSLRDARDRILPEDVDVIFFASAQNKTSVNKPMLNSMLTYKRFLEKNLGKSVEIIFSPSRYRNPTSPIENSNKVEDWWDDAVKPYLYYNKVQLNDVLISADSRISPTAKNPLTSYEIIAKDRHVVLPHIRVHLQTLPTFNGKTVRSISTSGSVTRRNFSISKAGETAEENFVNGFVVIEKKDDDTCYYPRNVKCNTDGGFTDIIYKVSEDDVKIETTCKGFVWGDIHANQLNENVYKATMNLYKKIVPEQTVIHDLCNFSTVNPHTRTDFYAKRREIVEGNDLIQDEIENSFDFLRSFSDINTKLNVIVSNHDVFLDRHINDMDWKKDLYNSPSYLNLAYIQQTTDLSEYGSLYGRLICDEFGNKVRYVKFGESLDICGYECGVHGDHGANGAKGSKITFSKLNTKMIYGHVHSPFIYNGVTAVGVTCNKGQYYTRKGLSSWAYAHSIIHNNCKNQLLIFTDDYKLSGLI